MRRLTIKFVPFLKESVIAVLYQNECLGLEEIEEKANELIFKVYFDEIGSIISQLKIVGVRDIKDSLVPPTDWDAAWRKSIKPIRLSPGFWVKPSWSDFIPRPGEDSLVIDPKMTFGTGHHETTRICADLIEQSNVSGKSLIDAGTGTGILAILAGRLGAEHIFAFDIDPIIADNAKENLERNNASGIRLFAGPIDTVRRLVKFDVVTVNMIREKIFSILDLLVSHLHDNGLLICSGFLVEEVEIVKERFFKDGLNLIKEKSKGEWWGGCWKKGCLD